jgi:hypothetical protein
MRRKRSSLLLLLVALVLVACTPQPRPPTIPNTASDEWSHASWEDRHDTMTFLVLPTMARSFQRFEGKPYPALTCMSCHGEQAERLQYRMPGGPPLDPAHLPRKDSSDAHEAKLAAFMIDEVTPSLAEMLGKSAVGCFTCHTKKANP